MRARNWLVPGLVMSLATLAGPSSSRVLSVEISTDRGHDAVYRDGDRLEIKARISDDAYLIVYDIDAEGAVHLLYPDGRSGGLVDGDRTIKLPDPDSGLELAVKGPVGQGYVVAIASRDPFRELPWYLRPYNAQAEEMGYQGAPTGDEDEAVTAEGRIVGDPFVAMERIRRRVVTDASDPRAFATAYASYYVHQEVRYPRYLCYDCHRPHQWAWWDGFDPYYAQCSVFDFRVNWSWGWGPSYWCGFVPYYMYVYRSDCPPRYRRNWSSGATCSSWDGSRRWRTLWGSQLTRYKSPPPQGYVPPTKYDPGQRGPRSPDTPPGYLARRGSRFGPEPVAGPLVTRDQRRDFSGARERGAWGNGRARPAPSPAVEPRDSGWRPHRDPVPEPIGRGDEGITRVPAAPDPPRGSTRPERPPIIQVPREPQTAPPPRRVEPPAPPVERRGEPRRDAPRVERPRGQRP